MVNIYLLSALLFTGQINYDWFRDSEYNLCGNIFLLKTTQKIGIEVLIPIRGIEKKKLSWLSQPPSDVMC